MYGDDANRVNQYGIVTSKRKASSDKHPPTAEPKRQRVDPEGSYVAGPKGETSRFFQHKGHQNTIKSDTKLPSLSGSTGSQMNPNSGRHGSIRGHGKREPMPSPLAKPPVEEGSIYDILRTCRLTGLFRHPLLWTAEHMSFLDMKFERAMFKEQPGISSGACPFAAFEKVNEVADLLSGCGFFEQIHPSVDLQFGGKGWVRFSLTRLLRGWTNWTISAAVIDLNKIQNSRLERCRFRPPMPRDPLAWPNYNTKKAKTQAISRGYRQLNRMTPSNRYEDPYLAALLLALAQRCDFQRPLDREQARAKAIHGNGERWFKSHLIVVSRDPKYGDWVHLYTTRFSETYLTNLQTPERKAILCDPIVIHYKPITAVTARELQEKLKECLQE
ncbi:hypothetical protein GQ53DRAFT_877206 [Thozetella sp. PMI_491]|nr:hypothetical protein GQ53DRAFT_877206 [Thozetella sp. PMI_491]